MRAFETVRSTYMAMYAFIWVIALGMIATTVFAVATDKMPDTPVSYILAVATGLVVLDLVLSWLLLITICAIDSRNFLAEIYASEDDKAETSARSQRHQVDRYDRRV